MAEISFRNRRAVRIENAAVRVTVLVEGGHIAEVCHKPSGVNPLWTPPWPSIEPSTYDPERHPEYASRLLAGIMGHNLCLPIFGSPSPEEAAAGMTAHGEGSVVPYSISAEGAEMVCTAALPESHMEFERRIRLRGDDIQVKETVRNLSALDRPVGWTQHVTLGPPFLKPGSTQFRASATRSRVFEREIPHNYMKRGADFDWPLVPREDGGTTDMQTYPAGTGYAGMSTHLMDPRRESAYFVAWSPESKVVFGYKWKRADFPWMAIWEENCSRTAPPWNAGAITRGFEFGVSPMPETPRQMIDRGSLFGVPGYRWIPARSSVSAEYSILIGLSDHISEIGISEIGTA